MRRPTARNKPRKSQVASFPAPVGGWVSNRSLAVPRGPDQPPGAAVLENWFPTSTGIILRRGCVRHATTNDASPIRAMFTYATGSMERIYAATDAAVYDVTTVSDPYDPTALSGLDVLSNQNGGDWSVVQFATSGGTFLIGVNGADPGFQFDGTAWQDADSGGAAITFGGSGLTTADMSQVWVYQKRVWFIQKNSLSAWYLAADSIGGAATELPLGGVFVRGGTLLWGQAWSLASGGAGGLSDQCVFCSTEGEVAAYQGIDPGDAESWSKVGTYRVGKPLGKKAIFKAGGDIGIATTVGLISLQSAANTDYAALGRLAISSPIEAEWARLVQERSNDDWRCQIWPDGQAMFVSIPAGDNDEPMILCANVNTGRWCKITAWDVTAMEVFGGRFWFGGKDGAVRQGWVGGSDEGMPYAGRCLTLFDNLDAPANLKVAKLARAVKRSTFDVNERLHVAADFNEAFPPMPNIPQLPTASLWDSGLWDQAIWDSAQELLVTARWKSVAGSGQDLAIGIQVASGANAPVDVEVIRFDLTYEVADVVT